LRIFFLINLSFLLLRTIPAYDSGRIPTRACGYHYFFIAEIALTFECGFLSCELRQTSSPIVDLGRVNKSYSTVVKCFMGGFLMKY
tara:strand:- start:65 stop:322 length:258 start_codon:yes stop_codon:yes gene_type:complete